MLREPPQGFAESAVRRLATLLRAAGGLALVWLVAPPARAVEMNYVIVGQPGNSADPSNPHGLPNLGAVPFAFRLGKYEVTNAEYAEFLNAKGASDPYGLYHGGMASDGTHGGIVQSGSAGSFTYAVKPGFASKPVVYVNFFDAVRFANWLHNGQGSSDTESGAYTLIPNPGNPPIPANESTLARQASAAVFIPNENEWYKAAYLQSDGTYRLYPTRSSTTPTAEAPPGGVNSVNCNNAAGGTLSVVGAYAQSPSASGTLDQAGNAQEWVETSNGGFRILRGGHFGNSPDAAGSFSRGYWFADGAFEHTGFRVAAALPPPDTPPTARGVWRILALGDSITQSSVPRLSYRYHLWVKLIAAGVQFDFLGSLTDNAGPGGNDPANWPPYQGRSFDQQHEGRAGKRTDEIAADLGTWMQSYTPDIVLLHAGSNDALQAPFRPAPQVIASLGDIIDVLRAKNPNVIVLLAKIIPLAESGANARVTAINDLIDGLATSQHTASSPVLVVDQNTGFNPNVVAGSDSYDGIHPNDAGEVRIAARWFEALQIHTLKAATGVDPAGHLTVSFLRIQAPVRLQYTVEVSDDLQQWFSGPAETEDAVPPVDHFDGTESVVIRDKKSTATDGQRFIRLRLSY